MRQWLITIKGVIKLGSHLGKINCVYIPHLIPVNLPEYQNLTIKINHNSSTVTMAEKFYKSEIEAFLSIIKQGSYKRQDG